MSAVSLAGHSPRWVVAVLAMVLALPSILRADPPVRRPAAAAAFDRPFYMGVYLGDSESRTEQIDGSLMRYTRMVGKRPALVKTFHRPHEDFSARGWSGQMVRRVIASGSTPFMALDLNYPGAPRYGLLDAIMQGRADAHFTRMARGLAGAGGVVMVSPAWEMNGRWNFAWQGAFNGESRAPAKYRASFQRIVDIFRREGAGNVKWVFSPNVGNPYTNAATGPAHWNWYGHYYPGDRYVDYLGPHGYNGPGVWNTVYKPFDALFDGFDADRTLSDLERRFPGKPIIIGEFAAQEVRGYDKGLWIAQAFAALRRHRSVVGAIWFNMDKETDWRINSSRSSLDAFRTAMADPNVRTSFR